MILSFSACSMPIFKLLDDQAEKSDIISYVKENEKLIVDCIAKKDYSQIKENDIVEDISADGDLIEFSCGGAGFGSATSYCGFYYSPDDDMTKIWCGPSDNEPLVESDKGYVWEQKDGDNTYYTEHICGHFYYYKSTY